MENNEINNENNNVEVKEAYALEQVEQMHYVFNISLLDKEGYWQILIFDFNIQKYRPIYNTIIFYKDHIFDSLESAPWDNERIETIRSEINLINKDDVPLCLCVHLRDLT